MASGRTGRCSERVWASAEKGQWVCRAEWRTGAWSSSEAVQQEPQDSEERASERRGTAEVIEREGRCEMGDGLACLLGTAQARWAMGCVMASAG